MPSLVRSAPLFLALFMGATGCKKAKPPPAPPPEVQVITAAQQAASQLEGQSAAAQAGAKDVGKKAMTFAERNIQASFEFAQKLLRAKDPQEVMRLQAELTTEQQRLEKARKKWGEDRASLDRARKALGAAMAQIDEAEQRPID